VARLLAGEAARAEVRAEAEEGRATGVTGVPTFVLGGKYVLTGAQPPETWARVIEELRTAAEA
jgi:predicted DsbA family dithiol-disulfide isomerase